jgi:hypothetical protein
VVITICGVSPRYDSVQSTPVMDTDELLLRLKERRVRNVDIARVLGLPDSRVPEIRDKRRALKYDEGVKLVRAFELEQGQEAEPLPASIIRLSIQYVARRLGVPEARVEPQLADLTEDLRAFSLFVAEPKVRRSIAMAEGFFRAMLLRRPRTQEAAPSETDPDRAQ